MLRLKCVNCGLLVPYRGSAAAACPRCLVREEKAVEMITVSDQPASPGSGTGRLTIRVRAQRGCHTLALAGELDISSAEMLETALDEAVSSGAENIVVDLGGVEFMDSTGLSALLNGRTLCEQHGCGYSLTPAQRPVERVFKTTGLRNALRFEPRASPTGTAPALES